MGLPVVPGVRSSRGSVDLDRLKFRSCRSGISGGRASFADDEHGRFWNFFSPAVIRRDISYATIS
jgi:hypothetical protein